jgi:hypothetical protein
MCVLAAFGSGCVAVNGGALELAWFVRTDLGDQADCGKDNLATVAVYAQPCDDTGGGGCAGADAPPAPVQTFDCDRGRGSTDFSIAPGRVMIWIAAKCANGDDAPGVTVPEPVLRDVTKGDVTELNALLISVPSTGQACSP